MSSATPSIGMGRTLKLSVDWRALITNFSDALVQGFATAHGITDGVSSAISALINVAGSVKIADDPEQKAWQLFWLSFGWTLDELRSEGGFKDDGLRGVVKDALEDARKKADDSSLVIPVSFLSRPTTLPLYKVVRDEFVLRSSEFRSSGEESVERLSARFDSAFNRAVFEIWARRAETFQSLFLALAAPGVESNTLEIQWSAYREKLIYDFEVRPVFGQEKTKISLAQLYIPLRGAWFEYGKDGHPPSGSHTIRLDDELDDWVKNPKPDDDLKLIGGGPGSGKSTTLKSFAARQALRPEVRPLYVPLQHISMDGNLKDAINLYFTDRTEGAFSQPPLARNAVEDGPPLVLIFDGLDEISRPGEGADEVANLFLSKLDQMVSSLRGELNKPVFVIAAGRMPSFQAAKKFRSGSDRSAIEVMGYAPNSNRGDGGIAALDQRTLWWGKYSSLTGASADVPAALSDSRLTDITNEPLLCYLLALSGFAVDNWEAAAENRNRIYEKLIDEVWKRGWGDGGKIQNRQGPGKNLRQSSFNLLMDAIALAAWRGGDTRVATEDSFNASVKIMHADEAWNEFKVDGGQKIANLAMNFYLKAADASHRGFEFTHKSFGDYLSARAIIAIAYEVSALTERHTDLAMQKWLESTSSGVLTGEILDYMRDEIRLIVTRPDEGVSFVEKIFQSFSKMAAVVLVEGLPAHKASAENWRQAARQQKNAEVMIWAVINSCARALHASSSSFELIRVGFEKNESLFKQLLVRVHSGDENNSPVGRCFSHIFATGSDLFGLNLSEVDLSFSDLSDGNLNGTHLMRSNMRGCKLHKTTFQRANLDRANFLEAEFEDTNLVDARVVESNIFWESEGTVRVSARTMFDFDRRRKFDHSRFTFDIASTHPKELKWDARAAWIENLRKSNRNMIKDDDSQNEDGVPWDEE